MKLHQTGPHAWNEVIKQVIAKRTKIIELLMQGRHSSKHIEQQIIRDIDKMHQRVKQQRGEQSPQATTSIN